MMRTSMTRTSSCRRRIPLILCEAVANQTISSTAQKTSSQQQMMIRRVFHVISRRTEAESAAATTSSCTTTLMNSSRRAAERIASRSTATSSKQQLHSSTKASKSTTTMTYVASHTPPPPTPAPPAVAAAATPNSAIIGDVPKPTWQALRTLFVTAAIPMVGFGFMDNVVMIQAGQYIDSTIGVSLGLATMSAAAAGQVVSDVSGVIFGGTLERFLTRIAVITPPDLTPAQRQLSLCRNVSMAGAVVGVIIGCALGATTLLLVDLEARDRIDRAHQLREIITDMINDGADKGGLAAESATVYFTHEKDFQMDSPPSTEDLVKNNDTTREHHRTKLVLMDKADKQAAEQIQACSLDRKVVTDSTGKTLYAPIVAGKELVAVIEFQHHHANNSSSASSSSDVTEKVAATDSVEFTREDLLTASVMARHIAIFMNRVRD